MVEPFQGVSLRDSGSKDSPASAGLRRLDVAATATCKLRLKRAAYSLWLQLFTMNITNTNMMRTNGPR
jgi:hypothetical protein